MDRTGTGALSTHLRIGSDAGTDLRSIDGQAGAIVGIAGELVCLDYVSRSDVFAGLHLKLLRGYALSAIEQPPDKPLVGPTPAASSVSSSWRHNRPAVGLGQLTTGVPQFGVDPLSLTP